MATGKNVAWLVASMPFMPKAFQYPLTGYALCFHYPDTQLTNARKFPTGVLEMATFTVIFTNNGPIAEEG